VSASEKVDVIVRTTLEEKRKSGIFRAIDSILSQQKVEAIPLIVANGSKYNKEIFDLLKARTDLRFIYVEEGSTSAAMRVGRQQVESPFFTFLDDDDELLPDALWTRMEPMLQDPGIDLVATSGFFESKGELKPDIPNISEHQDKPLLGIAKRCWLSSCGGLFRSSSITPEYCDGSTNYQELTLLAFKIAVSNKKILFLDKPTYVVHDSQGSLSKSLEHIEASEDVIQEMLQRQLPADVRAVLEEKYRNILHVLSASYFNSGRLAKSWLYHLRSMKPPYTLKYIYFTRKLLWQRRVDEKLV